MFMYPVLKNIAGELSISVLACLHTDAVAFRDLILQRLEFSTEDINLKVFILKQQNVISYHTYLLFWKMNMCNVFYEEFSVYYLLFIEY